MRKKLLIDTWDAGKIEALGKFDSVCKEMSRDSIQAAGITESTPAASRVKVLSK